MGTGAWIEIGEPSPRQHSEELDLPNGDSITIGLDCASIEVCVASMAEAQPAVVYLTVEQCERVEGMLRTAREKRLEDVARMAAEDGRTFMES